MNLTGGRREQTTEQQSSGNDSGSSTRTSISSSMEVEVDVEVARAIGWGWLDACSEVEATTTIATDQPAQPARWSPSGGHSSNASPPRATGGRRTGGGKPVEGRGMEEGFHELSRLARRSPRRLQPGLARHPGPPGSGRLLSRRRGVTGRCT